MTWLHRLRLRVFGVLVGAVLAVGGAVSVASLPVVPVVGVTLLTVAAVVNGMTARLAEPMCHSCGAELAEGSEAGVYGVVCERCGAINQDRGPGVPSGPRSRKA